MSGKRTSDEAGGTPRGARPKIRSHQGDGQTSLSPEGCEIYLAAVRDAKRGLELVRQGRRILQESERRGDELLESPELTKGVDEAIAQIRRAEWELGAWVGLLEHGWDPK